MRKDGVIFSNGVIELRRNSLTGEEDQDAARARTA